MDDRCWKPVAAWSGTLILPPHGARRADGGVLIRLDNAPEPWTRLVGAVCALAWRPESAWARHASRETVDVRFTAEALASVARKRDVHPTRLDGWDRVSPLETLAGARPADDLRVSLAHPSVFMEEPFPVLSIDDEPVQVEGSRRALARFERPLDEAQTRWTVRHWDVAAHDFTGPEEVVRWEPDPLPAHRAVPQSSLDRVHRGPANRYGWYLYADPEPAAGAAPVDPDGLAAPPAVAVLRAVEPRAIRTAGLAPAVPGALRDYLDRGLWDNSAGGTWFQAAVPPPSAAGGSAPVPGATAPSAFPAAFRPGDRGLVVHLFGWRSGPRGDPPAENGHVAGHVSCGCYTIIVDPFTGEPVIDITYAQAYSHNPEGIVSGFIASHAYLGSLRRGWLWLTPVSDVLVHSPAFSPAGQLPLADIRLSLSRMLAHARSGAGTGLTPANMAVSCAQNTALALYEATLMDAGRRDSPAAQALRRTLAPLGRGRARILPPRWRAYLRGRPFRPILPGQKARLYLNALLSRNSILPRELHDNLALVFHGLGAALRFVRSNQPGGVIEGIEPQRPTTFKDKYPPRKPAS